MTSALDDEDLALSINLSHTRRNSTRGDDLRSDDNVSAPAGSGYAESQFSRENTSSTSTTSLQQRLQQYTILRTLGEGSFGKVKLAIHKTSGQKVALKIINRKKLMARDMQGRTEREIQYLQLLRHPHIIKLYTVITTSSEIVMVLEYAGSELFNYIVEHGKMQEDKARVFFQQIVCAVEYCHRHKIVHRDLKPENLLLDEQLHVKIADFGLSNIMTDGNFLKTSCGSPNYAAPEVISGKLYAGPEVDVWSCGVILYVLLAGRLPFDDEYIPALFKKIAQGSYHMPSHISPGAARLIKRMLQVSPMQRTTIQEIRQDAWFNVNLAEYLQQPAPEFVDTGVDPNKAINPRDLAPTKSDAVVAQMHTEVIGKLGKAMGYGREDVQQALSTNEPNAIKDAYLIVRENQMIKETPALTNDPTMQPFLAQSPPTFAMSSPIERDPEGSTPHPLSLNNPGQSHMLKDRSRQGSTSGMEVRPHISTIGVLPDSLPEFHAARMRGQPSAEEGTDHSKDGTGAANLKPHSRVSAAAAVKPEAMTPMQAAAARRVKPTKWQFGIRSRNAPSEAMLAIFKALKRLDAEWEVVEIRTPGRYGDDGQPDQNQADESGISGSDEDDDDERDPERRRRRRSSGGTRRSYSSTSRGRNRSKIRYGSWNDWGLLVPADPWVINARFRKDGMYPPGVLHAHSANSSRIDLNAESVTGEEGQRRGRSSTMSSTTSISGMPQPGGLDNASFSGPGLASQVSLGSAYGRALSAHNPIADDSAYVYLTVQLYSIEKEFYLVDFKCAGYERLVRRLVRQVEVEAEDEADDEEALTDDEAYGSDDSDDVHRMELMTGKPREAGQWEALRKISSSHSARRTRKRNDEDEDDEDDDADSQGGTKSNITLVEEIVSDGRAVEEKDVSSPFPFLDVASRLIIQLAEAE